MVQIKRKHGRSKPRSWISLYWAEDGWFSVFFLIMAGFFAFWSSINYGNAKKFEASSVVVQAAITDKRILHRSKNKYYMTFKYALQDGQIIILESRVPKSLFRQVGKGAETPIRYLIDEPTKFETNIGASRKSFWLLLTMGLFFGAMGLAFFWINSKRANAAILARQYGRKAFGDVVEIEKTQRSKTILSMGRLVWRDEDGGRGVSLIYRRKLLDRYQAGDRIHIFMQNGKSWWEGDVGSRKPGQENAL